MKSLEIAASGRKAEDTFFVTFSDEQLDEFAKHSCLQGGNVRKLGHKHYREYIPQMRDGVWIDCHPQGIIIDPNTGKLVDGQHRIAAERSCRSSRDSGDPDFAKFRNIEWRVTFHEAKALTKLASGKSFVMADQGKSRSDADYIAYSFGDKDPNAAALAQILANFEMGRSILAHFRSEPVHMEQLLETYGNNKDLIEAAKGFAQGLISQTSYRIGVSGYKFFARAMQLGWDRKVLEDFVEAIVTNGYSCENPDTIRTFTSWMNRNQQNGIKPDSKLNWQWIVNLFSLYVSGSNRKKWSNSFVERPASGWTDVPSPETIL